jgi:hypothetical protein
MQCNVCGNAIEQHSIEEAITCVNGSGLTKTPAADDIDTALLISRGELHLVGRLGQMGANKKLFSIWYIGTEKDDNVVISEEKVPLELYRKVLTQAVPKKENSGWFGKTPSEEELPVEDA